MFAQLTAVSSGRVCELAPVSALDFNVFSLWQESCTVIRRKDRERRLEMLYWALVFLLIAILAAVLGFTGISLLAAGVAKLLFFIFLVLFVVSLVAHIARRA